MYITADEKTRDYFYRFQKVKITDPRSDKRKTWQVAGVDPYYGDGIIQVFLDEYFENTFEDIVNTENKMMKKSNLIGGSAPYIEGPLQVKQYSKEHYLIHNATGGKWYINWKNQEHDLEFDGKDLLLDIPIRELGVFTLIYRVNGDVINFCEGSNHLFSISIVNYNFSCLYRTNILRRKVRKKNF